MKHAIAILLLLITLPSVAQIRYGSNPAAGKYYAVNGVKLYVEEYGRGKPLLLIHGNGGSIEAFSKTIPYFAKSRRVIAVDSRAQGKSVDLGDSLSFEQMADDFAALLTTLKLDSVDVIGWSDGGINAILLAMRHPKKVHSFVSTGANLTPDSTALIPASWKDMQRIYAADHNKPRTTAKEKNDWKVFMLDMLQPNIPMSALQAVRCPALIVAGDRDVIVTQHTVAIQQHIPGAQLWILPNSGHATLIDHADEFNRKTDAFFRAK
ncbi:alpha/beta fold hydrolase [Fibrella aquatilis]|uniref:Alpha/beta hydrolase n=1 Tax=Fibrella aquatilis TaxID=2817059 RepID=A0A939G4Y4_9BACT|nr:alpha/beta hydrolase [Fibrella aquatilis]MBO0930704.1 alpha/beta hydrolase [Fibrella aquatilis]